MNDLDKIKLSSEQKKVVYSNESKIVVIAAAASGKTRCITERVKYLLESGDDPSQIVVITFTNMAAEELYNRLGRPRGLFVGTIHGYANYLLNLAGVSTNDILDEEKFDKLFFRVRQHPECIRPVQYLLVDETQDSNQLQFEFFLDMVRPRNYMLVGDYRQSMYRWCGAKPNYLIDLSRSWCVTTYQLNENYRNGSKILDFARSIIEKNGSIYYDHSIPMRDATGKFNTIDYKRGAISKLIEDSNDDYKDWFVLCRTNLQADAVARELKISRIPLDTFKQSELNQRTLLKKMNEDTVKVLTIHSAKGLEAKNVAVIGAKFYTEEEKCISYVAATRARDNLYWIKKFK